MSIFEKFFTPKRETPKVNDDGFKKEYAGQTFEESQQITEERTKKIIEKDTKERRNNGDMDIAEELEPQTI